MVPWHRTPKFLLASAVVGLLLVSGCDVGRTPTASEGPAPATVEPAAKLLTLPEGGITVSGLIGALGGTLTVVEEGGPGPEDDLRVDFNVESGSLTSLTLVTMIVLDDTLTGDLVLDFSPDGLDFSEDAEIDARMGEALVDREVEDITAWHEHDGQVDDATITYRSHVDETVHVKVAVPGFSRYGLRR